jgi:hypothetical protein
MSSKLPYDGRDERGRTTVLPPVLRSHMFRKGEVHNPAGRGGEYQRCLKLCRESSYEAAKEIIRLSRESEDERVRYTAANWVYEHAWGKPKDYDPTKDKPQSGFNPADYTPEELNQIEAALRLIMSRRDQKQAEAGIMPPESR